MVRYYFTCENEHVFDMWFKDIAFFEQQYSTPNSIICPICGTFKVSKKLMAPVVIKGKSKTNHRTSNKITTDVEKINKQLVAFKKYIVNNFDYVGKDFKNLAIKMYKGEIKKKNIYGESSAEDIKELNKEGVDVLALNIVNVDSKKIN